jgi:hypothetical protein
VESLAFCFPIEGRRPRQRRTNVRANFGPSTIWKALGKYARYTFVAAGQARGKWACVTVDVFPDCVRVRAFHRQLGWADLVEIREGINGRLGQPRPLRCVARVLVFRCVSNTGSSPCWRGSKAGSRCRRGLCRSPRQCGLGVGGRDHKRAERCPTSRQRCRTCGREGWHPPLGRSCQGASARAGCPMVKHRKLVRCSFPLAWRQSCIPDAG